MGFKSYYSKHEVFSEDIFGVRRFSACSPSTAENIATITIASGGCSTSSSGIGFVSKANQNSSWDTIKRCSPRKHGDFYWTGAPLISIRSIEERRPSGVLLFNQCRRSNQGR